MSNNYSKQLSKEQITQKLVNLNYPFEEKYWNDFEEHYQMHKPNTTNINFQFNPKLLLIPVGLLVVSLVVYFSVVNMGSHNAGKEDAGSIKVNSSEEDLPIVAETPNETNKEVIVPAIDTVKKEIKPPVEPVKSKEPNLTINQPVKNTTVTQQAVVVKMDDTAALSARKVSTTPPQTDIPKKKKRRRKGTDNTDTTPVPSPEEDEVVVPE